MSVLSKISNPLSVISRTIIPGRGDLRTDLIGKSILYFLVLAETLICFFWIYVLSSLGDGYALMAAVPYFYLIISYTSLLIFYRLKRFDYFTFTQLLMLLVMPFFMQWVVGGFGASSGLAIWAILSPVGALMILGARQSTPWFGLFLALAAVSWQLNSVFASSALQIPNHIKDLFFLMNLIGVASILYGVMRYFQAQKARVLDALEAEQARSEKLLLNIFPQPIVDRLKQDDYKIADSYESATIMFADLVDFTGITEGMAATNLVDLLNRVFSEFDVLTEKHGLEKIKTIGDSYMVAGGVPSIRSDHAVAVAEMALEIGLVLAKVSEQTGQKISMRIGINSGPVIAGVIGTTKFSYDLWGDAVNLASRMEQYGVSGSIQVTESTHELLKNQYVFEDRGMISVKGKGSVKAYLLQGRR
ncbi:MAG TPA: adenylate/guanylate cyclase domain-containing protein [Methylophilaceae bacterium]|nr:adenylate/guanylate cyclase domain-containing protein [Methylophilaceae bacterium]